MNLRAIANRATSGINPNISATLRRSTGYTTAANGVRTPVYTDAAAVVQVQAMSGGDLRQVESLNIQGDMRAVYFTGGIAGTVRTGQKGGDLLVFDAGVLLPASSTWLCVQVLEQWADWCKCAVVLQNGA